MELTGKCKADFEKWFFINDRLSTDDIKNIPLLEFYTLGNSAKYGVYVNYFDSVGIWIMSGVCSIESNIAIEFIAEVETEDAIWNTLSKTRGESMEKGVEKAVEIRNQQLKYVLWN